MRNFLIILSSLLLISACTEKNTNNTTPDKPDETTKTVEVDTATSPPDIDGDGWTLANGDCDDSDPERYPGASESCDEVDEDCDDIVDENAIGAQQWHIDSDADGFGDAHSVIEACERPDNHLSDDSDCDDSNSNIHPDAEDDRNTEFGEDCGPGGLRDVIAVNNDCPNEVSFYGQRTNEEAPLHMIYVYNVDTSSPFPLHVESQEPMTLVLASYREVSWEVTEAIPGTIKSLYVFNPNSVDVTAPEGTPVRTYPEANYIKANFLDWDFSPVQGIVAKIEQRAARPLESYFSCSAPTSITLVSNDTYPASSAAYPDCDSDWTAESLTRPDTSLVKDLKGCTEVIKESTWCLTTDGEKIKAVGMETGVTCDVIASEYIGESLLWSGEYLYLCSYQHHGVLTRISLASGLEEKSHINCEAIAGWRNELLITAKYHDIYLEQGMLHKFESFEQAQCEIGGHQSWEDWYNNLTDRNLSVYEGFIYTQWHADHIIERLDIPDINTVTEVEMEGYDGLMHGLDVIKNNQLIINATQDGEKYLFFETPSGTALREIPWDGHATYGLECISQ